MPRRGESVYKRADGRWEARYIDHYESGRAIYRYVYAASYAEVKQKRLDAMCAALSPALVEPTGAGEPSPALASAAEGGICFEHLAARWLADKRTTIKESSYTRYARTVEKYLLPAFGTLPPHALQATTLTRYLQSLSEGGGLRGEPLSAKTVGDIYCVLRAICRYSEKSGYPCGGGSAVISLPRPRHRAEILSASARRALEELLLTWSPDDTVRPGILLALYTGLRIGELCGLRWEDIDLVGGTITVCRTVERIADLDAGSPRRTKVIISEPKTESGFRLIPLPTFLCHRLREVARPDDCYLLTGTPHCTEPHQFYLRYKTLMRRIGLEQYTFHALRHTFATRCVEMGFDVKSLSEILGHANVSTTLSIYIHPTLEQKRAQMERLMPG